MEKRNKNVKMQAKMIKISDVIERQKQRPFHFHFYFISGPFFSFMFHFCWTLDWSLDFLSKVHGIWAWTVSGVHWQMAGDWQFVWQRPDLKTSSLKNLKAFKRLNKNILDLCQYWPFEIARPTSRKYTKLNF